MGTEILDFDDTPEPQRPGSVLPNDDAADPEPTPYLEDLGDVAPPTGPAASAGRPRAPGGRRLRTYLAGLRHERRHRVRLLQLTAAAVVLVLLSAFVADHRATSRADQAADARLAVDLRVDRLPELTQPDGGGGTKGDAQLDLTLHNLGLRPVRLTGLLYRFDNDPTSRQLLRTDVVVPSGHLMDRTFDVVLPCGPNPQTAVPGRGGLTAQVRTDDGTTHAVPVDVGALDALGGLFSPCRVYARLFGAYDANSQIVGNGVRITLSLPTVDLTGSNFVTVGILRTGVPAGIDFVSSPALPEQGRAGTRISVFVRPVVQHCPRQIDLTDVIDIGLRIGSDTYPDPYLPLVLAREVGRVCAAGPHR